MNILKKRSVTLLLCFALPAAVMAAVFAVCGLCPFGNGTVGVMDMPHQYLSFLYSLRDILTGEESLLYLPGMCLGGNMAGLFAYYLTSPLNLLTCLFSMKDMYAAVGLLYLLRVGLCGLTMGIYCGSRRGWGAHCLFPAAAFGLMAYMAAYCFNYLWQDSIILMPIAALGIARIVDGRKAWLYLIALAAALMLNFYIGYILCLFSVLYFAYELFSRPGCLHDGFGKKIGRFALGSLAAGCLAAVILLPAVFALMGGKAEVSDSVLTLGTNFPFIEMFSKLYTGAFVYEEIMPEGLPNIYCGTLTTALAVLYFANRKIPLRRRILTGGLFAVLALSFWLTALDLVWHGLNTPEWYNHRYSFLFCFLLAAAADRQLCECDGTGTKWLFVPAALCAVGSLAVFIGREYTYAGWINALEAVLTAALLGAGILLYRKHSGRRGAAVLLAAVLVVQLGELGANAGITLKSLTAQAVDNTAWQTYAESMQQAVDAVPDTDEYVRTESTVTFSQNRCEGMLFGYDGLSHYGSTTAKKNLDFLESVGLNRYADLWAAYGSGVTSAAESLLGVRYIIDTGDTQNAKGYEQLTQAGGYTVLENTGALPIGWMADSSFADTVEADNCFDTLNALYAQAAPSVGEDIFSAAQVTDTQVSGFEVNGTEYTLVGTEGGNIDYTLTVTADGPLYAQIFLPTLPSVTIFCNDEFCLLYGNQQENGSLYLGTFSAGDTVTVSVRAHSDLTLTGAAFATEQRAVLDDYLAELSSGGCSLEKISDSHYTGSFTADADGLLVLTIPYDKGWNITVDGASVQASEVQGCLTAISVSAGTHIVEMRYTPAGLAAGAGVTGITILICAAVFVWEKRREKKV